MKKSSAIKWLFLVVFLFAFVINEKLFSDKKIIPSQPLSLNYIANEGVMLTSGNKKILIDAIFNFPYPDYVSPDRETIIKMLLAQPPFDHVNLILVTHNHPDHFDATLVSQFMEKHLESHLVAPEDTVLALKKKSAHWDRIKNRVISIKIEVNEIYNLSIENIGLRCVRTLHDDEKIPANLIYLIKMDEWTILHEGDSTTSTHTFKKLVTGYVPVDLALVHFWFPLNSTGKSIIKDVLRAKHTALMHLTRNFEKDVPEWIKEFEKDYEDIFFLLPGMKIKTFTK